LPEREGRELNRVKRFVFDGILASKDLQDVARGMGPETDLIRLSTLEEATDPAWYPAELVVSAGRSTRVYYRLYLFENKVRRLIERVLSESKGADWYETSVPGPVKEKAQDVMEREGMARFQGPRGANPLSYCFLSDLGKIIDANWADFEEVMYRRDWAMGRFEDLRLIRNAIAHMSEVAEDDQNRLDIILRDWNRQIG
jgi:hypothetical protein